MWSVYGNAKEPYFLGTDSIFFKKQQQQQQHANAHRCLLFVRFKEKLKFVMVFEAEYFFFSSGKVIHLNFYTILEQGALSA